MDRITGAFEAIDRAQFLPPALREEADVDVPLPIGYGQTNSQPTTVRMMLEWLDPHPGDKVLDVGSGSGWSTALLGYIVRPKGKVYAVERVPELLVFGRSNVKRAGIRNAEFFQASDVFGLSDHAPFDRILVSATAGTLPRELVEQLKTGGKLVIPVGSTIYEITKTKEGLRTTPHPGFAFVPLIK